MELDTVPVVLLDKGSSPVNVVDLSDEDSPLRRTVLPPRTAGPAPPKPNHIMKSCSKNLKKNSYRFSLKYLAIEIHPRSRTPLDDTYAILDGQSGTLVVVVVVRRRRDSVPEDLHALRNQVLPEE